MNELMGFPRVDTNINYFAQQVHQGGHNQVIKEWDEAQAAKDLKKLLITYVFSDEPKETHEASVKEVLEKVDISTEYTMLKDLGEHYPGNDWHHDEIGWRYTSQFNCAFRAFKVWTEMALKDGEFID